MPTESLVLNVLYFSPIFVYKFKIFVINLDILNQNILWRNCINTSSIEVIKNGWDLFEENEAHRATIDKIFSNTLQSLQDSYVIFIGEVHLSLSICFLLILICDSKIWIILRR